MKFKKIAVLCMIKLFITVVERFGCNFVTSIIISLNITMR